VKVATVDLGSNTVKLLVASREAGGTWQVEHEDARVTRLAEGLGPDRRTLLPEARVRTLDALAEMVQEARSRRVDAMACVATAGLRATDDANAFVAEATRRTGLEISVVDGLQEGQLAFRGAAARVPGDAVVIDVGGRSTEVVAGADGRPKAQVTLELGGLGLTQQFLTDDPPTERQLFEMRAAIQERLESLPKVPRDAQLLGVSGTFLSLMGHKLGTPRMRDVLAEGEGQTLTLGDVHHAYDTLRRKPAADRVLGDVIPPGRADIIVAGTAVILEVMVAYERGRVVVTRRGLRYGLAEELVERAQRSQTGA
jgi:exopolyphosphatase/guanosine-5'-triphosphate,3'-diphosphate pyrophosphatase